MISITGNFPLFFILSNSKKLFRLSMWIELVTWVLGPFKLFIVYLVSLIMLFIFLPLFVFSFISLYKLLYLFKLFEVLLFWASYKSFLIYLWVKFVASRSSKNLLLRPSLIIFFLKFVLFSGEKFLKQTVFMSLFISFVLVLQISLWIFIFNVSFCFSNVSIFINYLIY